MLIFPVAVALSRLLRADPFSNGNALGELVGHTHMSVITLTFPMVIAAFVYMPEAMPLPSRQSSVGFRKKEWGISC